MGKIKLLLYCTKSKPYLIKNYDGKYIVLNKLMVWDSELNGEIVAECDFEVEEITNCGTSFMIMKYDDLQESYRYTNKIAKGSCLNYNDLRRYLGTNNGYAIHIKNLNIFDKPRDLRNYITVKEFLGGKQVFLKEIKKAPQNMMYAYGKNTGEKYILISINPEWICKILNSEKTIEVRKKVLKEMIDNA